MDRSGVGTEKSVVTGWKGKDRSLKAEGKEAQAEE